MISVECGEFGTNGIADLSEAIALAKLQGISNARGAIKEEIPGVLVGSETSELGAYAIDTRALPNPARSLVIDAEKAIVQVAGDDLPGWSPTTRIPGVRLVTMLGDSRFYPHTDDYEGLVASLQWFIDGEKRIQAHINDKWVDEPINWGDITFFAGDSFSPKSRRFHGFTLAGKFAAAFTLGQDPYYTISGKYPLMTEHPEYGFNVPQ